MQDAHRRAWGLPDGPTAGVMNVTEMAVASENLNALVGQMQVRAAPCTTDTSCAMNTCARLIVHIGGRGCAALSLQPSVPKPASEERGAPTWQLWGRAGDMPDLA